MFPGFGLLSQLPMLGGAAAGHNAITRTLRKFFGDHGGTHKGQVRKTARRAYEKRRIGDRGRKRRKKRRLPPRDKKGRFRKRRRRRR